MKPNPDPMTPARYTPAERRANCAACTLAPKMRSCAGCAFYDPPQQPAARYILIEPTPAGPITRAAGTHAHCTRWIRPGWEIVEYHPGAIDPQRFGN